MLDFSLEDIVPSVRLLGSLNETMRLNIIVNANISTTAKEMLCKDGIDIYSEHEIEKDKVDCVICSRARAQHFIEFPNLRWIHLTSAGYDGLDLKRIKERGIILTNSRGVYSIPIAEDTLTKMLLLSRNYLKLFENRKDWREDVGQRELFGKTVGILGAGSIGQEIARRAKAFGMKVIGFDPLVDKAVYFDDIVQGNDGLKWILSLADFLILSLPLTDQTKYLMNAKSFNLMKPSAYVINISRGAIVCTEDLICAIEEGKLAGAALDVFEEEPVLPDSPLWENERILITPHQAYIGDGNYGRSESLWVENAMALKKDEIMQNIIDLETS